MKTNLLKRVSVSVSLILLALTFLLSGPGVDQAVVSAAEYVREFNGSINTNVKDYFDNSVLYQLPDGVQDSDRISVIVSFDAPALIDAYGETDKSMTIGEYAMTEEAEAIRAQMQAEKQTVLAALDAKEIGYTGGAEYTTVINGFEIVIEAGDFKSVVESLGDKATAIVGEVYNPAQTQLVENEVDFDERTGIFDSSDFAYSGDGMLVAVLDTGLDYTHSAFLPNSKYYTSTEFALTKDDVAALVGDTRAAEILNGLTADDVYINSKVPFAFDYADSDSDVYSLHNNHGTHVSGVIVGHDDTIRGVAPNAQLVSMKIFSDVKESAYTSWIISALEDCVILGVDVINMSLGTACGYSREVDREKYSEVYDKIRDQGISLIVAASNSFTSSYASEKNGNLGLTSNPDNGTVGSPSTYDSALSVASVNGVKTPYLLFNGQILYFDESTNAATKERNFFDDILPDGVDEKEFEYVTVPGAGREADYAGIDVTGKIVLVERGFNTFEEKANTAEKMGAAGVIIYNNVSGDIRMNVGTTKIAVCSLKQEDGALLAEQKTGVLKISRSQTSGPFMSDFSSWGPTPDLGIKPEITAHGGNIYSAVTGGGYEQLSGTSMACPNMAGVVILLRQYVKDKFPEIANDPVEVVARVNRLLMSTANILINTNGLPYAVRKQGAGLASLTDASTTPAYILTYDENGNVMDKSKIELGDDPQKTGVYTLKFTVQNFESTALSYNLSSYVMTEGVSDTKTHKGETTVNEEGYILDGATVTFSAANGSLNGNTLTVAGKGSVEVTVVITLSDSDKEYLNSSFENGMYVEGFITLDAVSGTEVDLSVPYLAFYGDWTKAPLFDIDYFETHADELDDSIETLDKTLPDSYATRPIGGVSEDYVSYLGSYYFVQDPTSSKIISAKREYIAISNVEGTIHSLRFVWAGMLRNAERIEISIIDDSTGETVYETIEYGVRKSYGDGGTIRPSNVEIEFDAAEHNLKNNTEYTVRLVGYLDYGDGGLTTNENNVFEFPLVADFEAPAITDCEFYTEYDRDLKKNRLYARMAVYDNHYTMALMIGYVGLTTDSEGTSSYNLVSFDSYLTPVYSVRDGVTYVEYELTDYVQEIKNNSAHKNSFTVACYDYALNEATYEISLPDEYLDFYFEESEIQLYVNEVYSLTPLLYPETEWGELLHYESNNSSIADVVNDKLVAKKAGTTAVYAYEKNEDGTPGRRVKLTIKVLDKDKGELKPGDTIYPEYNAPVADVFELIGYDTLKAYYVMDTQERELGETGDYRVLFGSSLGFYPSESIQLHYKLDAYFPEKTTVLFESSNEKIVTVSDQGVITAQAEGFASVTVSVLLDGQSTYYSKSLDIEVKDPFLTTAPSLTHYFGLGGVVEIPDTLLITQIGDFAFSNYEYVPKTEEDIISEDEPDTTKMWYIGDNTITKVIIPEGVEKIGAYAFANLTALEEVVLPSTIQSIEYGAFVGCTSLRKVTGIENVMLINKDAFSGCNLTGTITLNETCAVGDYAFANNINLKNVVLSEKLQSIGAYAFYGNQALESVTVKAEKVKYGAYVFASCTSLTSISINSNVIPTGAFYGAKKLESVTIGKDVSSIGEQAFGDTALTAFQLDPKNTAYQTAGDRSYLLSADGKSLVLVAPRASGTFTLTDPNVTTVAKGAFSSNSRLTSVVIPSVTRVEDYAFAYCSRLSSISLGTLKYIGDYAFFRTGISEAPSFEAVNSIGAYAFAYTNLQSLSIPSGSKTQPMKIGEGAFCECDKLATVTIGDYVEIGTGAFLLNRDDNSTLILDPAYTAERFYSFEYLSPLTSLTIGNHVVIGDSAFLGAAKLVSVTLGEGAEIGAQAFYNACSLKEIDLSKAISIGKSAFSGDELYMYGDSNQNSYAMNNEGSVVLKKYAPVIEKVDLSSATSLGEQAFLYCDFLKEVKLGEGITEIPALAFYRCVSLTEINLDKIVTVGSNAFVETILTSADLSSAETIEKYAFVYCDKLVDLKLNPNGTELEEGAFAYCTLLTAPQNLNAVKKIGPYAFAYTGIVNADLSSATSIDDHAFLKETLTDFTVKLGSSLTYLGDNPFAMCKLEPFFATETVTFNGKDYSSTVYTYDISDSVHVIDGSLYCDVPNGMELIAYAGTDSRNVAVADGTVRITAMAFAGSDVIRVSLPHSLSSIGHKAFFDCNKLSVVVFASYEAPNLEEEFDSTYYESYQNLPATGDYEFVLWNGTEVTYPGLEIVPYYMWNLSDGKYSNVYYGANFVDYIGKVDDYIVMVSPSNGLYYDTFIYGKYFSANYAGAVAADEITMAAIEAINKLVAITDAGGNITLEHKQLVLDARAAYDKIATKEQQALVTNYSALLSAEDRINALENPDDDSAETPLEPDGAKDNVRTVLIVVVIVESIIILAAAVVALIFFLRKKRKDEAVEAPAEETEAPAEEGTAAEADAEPAEAAADEADAAPETEAEPNAEAEAVEPETKTETEEPKEEN